MLDLQGLKLKSVANHFCESEMVISASVPSEIKVLPDHHNHFCQTWRPYKKPHTMAYATKDYKRLEEFAGIFLKEANSAMKQRTEKIRRLYLKIFLSFINSKELTIEEMTEENMKEYLSWLINERNYTGLYFQPRTIFMVASLSRKFTAWLEEKGIIRKNPFSPSYLPQLPEMDAICRKRREEQKEKNIHTSDEDIFTTYETFIRQYRNARLNPTVRTLETLKKYLYSKGISLKELTLADYETIRGNLLNLELIPDRNLAFLSIVKCIRYLLDFEHWLFDEGYILKRQLTHWTRPELRKYVIQKFEEIKASNSVRERYYNISELMRAYKSRLQKRVRNVYLFQQSIKNINCFLQYLISQGKTLYTATVETLESYKQYLLNYEYRPGCHWKSHTQLFMIRDIRRFYDWLTIKKYCECHPLKDFKQCEYREWLKQNIKPDSRLKKPVNWFDELLDGFTRYEELKGFALETRKHHKRGCLFFFKYLGMSGIEDMKEVTRETIRNYLFYLAQYKDKEGEPFSVNNQIKHISGVKSFCEYLEKYGLIEGIVSIAIEYPKEEKGLPTPGFNNFEAKLLIESAKGNTPRSLRDRVFFELLYSSGMRSNEMCQLKMNNIDLINGMVRIDVPKGGRQYERVIPIGKNTCQWLERYIKEIRSQQSKRSPYLFLNSNGRPFRTCVVLNAVKVHLMKSPMKKRRIITHSFRVSCATEMLRKGANVKIVQEQLGHKVITSTEKYLRLVPNDLKKAHEQYHPRG